MFRRILIANRGEIACRIARTARKMGIESIAVYSDADANALHVKEADFAVHIGPAAPTQSYLDAARILAVAQDMRAEAIHPGYGFLSENADFARRCEEAGIVFIGPGADAIDAMGSKSRAKAIMEAAGVPLIPGYHGDDQSDDTLHRAATDMGYPVLLKATAGGGGKGMRGVLNDDEFDEALAAARRESAASFGDDRMLVEKLIQRPRHVEVQVFCDSHGNGVYLAERDCSIQRRHQKVIEEAPAPGLSEELRKAMGEAAVEAARAIDYRGAGTVEFLLDTSGAFYFMEMNTRLQVEHPVTEMITGQDLVEWQLRVANGETLPLEQTQVRVSGHAMEARIYAEDTDNGFLPSTGTIHYLRTPAASERVRIDTGIVEGSEISPFYDPMIAKLVVHGSDRDEARRQLVTALEEYQVAGTHNNIAFLSRIAKSEPFANAELDTGFIEDHSSILTSSNESENDFLSAAAALLQCRRGNATTGSNDSHSPWNSALGFRVNLPATQQLALVVGEQDLMLEINLDGDAITVNGPNFTDTVSATLTDDELIVNSQTQRKRYSVACGNGEYTIFGIDGSFSFSEQQLEVRQGGSAAGDAGFSAPMHGTVVAQLVEPGTQVQAGDGVIVIEAMKMEQTLRAPVAGTVRSYNAKPGDLVDRGAALVDFQPEASV